MLAILNEHAYPARDNGDGSYHQDGEHQDMYTGGYRTQAVYFTGLPDEVCQLVAERLRARRY